VHRLPSRAKSGAGGGGTHAAPLALVLRSDRRTRCSVPPVVRRSLSRAKPSGGRGGARTRPTLLVLVVLARRCSLPALTSTTGIDRRRPPLCCKTYVSSVFKCFIGMLQVFYVDIVKVDRDIAYVAMVVHVCCKLLFPMFHLFSNVCCKCVYLDVVYVSHTCCKCFICILRVFSMVSSVFQMFLKCFIRMFQVFNLSSDVCCKCCI
jgi:hypothetical protein